jgi:type IV secretory pathway TraG/TraD family ATPase VirD4
MSGARVLMCRVLRSVHRLPVRVVGAGVLAALLAWLTSHAAVLEPVTPVLTLAALGLVGGGLGWWWIAWVAPVEGTKDWVDRRDHHSERAGGVATWLDVVEHAGRGAMRARARVLRPSLTRAPVWSRWRVPTTAFAVPLVKAGWAPVGSVVWSSCEEVTTRFGGPRSGKSASLAVHAVDAPGALLVTSSRTDMLEATEAVRRVKGRVDVFNPTGMGGLASTVRWSPLAGCTDLATAKRRAADLIPPGVVAEGERWDAQARALLAVLLHAAALAGGSMRQVLDWVSPADGVAEHQVLTALKASPSARALSAEVRSVYRTNERTLTSITATLLPAVRWLTDTTAAAVGDADPRDPEFLDVFTLVAGGTDSLFLIGREGDCRPLIGALTAEIAHQVRMVAAALPGGRLDPPMTAVLDEVPLTCGPVPLDDWTADMGGRGLTLHLAAQSPAQLRDTYGADRAQAILGNTGSLLVFGGLKAADDLDRLSTLCGTRLYQVDDDDRRPTPVMTPGEIAALPPGTALLIRTALRPVIGRAPAVWDTAPARATRRARRTLRARSRPGPDAARTGAGPDSASGSATPAAARAGDPPVSGGGLDGTDAPITP